MRRFAVVIGLLLGMSASVGAETYRFTLEEAIAYGLANSTTIQSKKLAVAAAQADLAAARSGYYPSLSASAGWTHLGDQPTQEFPPFGSIYLSATDPVSLSLELSQSLYTFGKLKNAVKLAREAAAQAGLDLAEENRKTVVLIRNAFYGYLLALEVARQRYQAGLAPEYEVLQAESDLESFKATVISSNNGVRIALLNVRNVLGIEEEEFEFELVGELEPIPLQIDRDLLLGTALSGRYDLQNFRKLVDIAGAQEQLNRSLRLPTLVGFASYSVQSGLDSATGANDYSLDAWGWGLEAVALGLNLSVPVSAFAPWSEESAAIRKSRIQLEDLRLQYEALQSSVRIAVESAILKIAEERAKIASGRKSVDLAQRLYEAAVEQYEGGYISNVELEDAQLGLNSARLAYAQAIFNFNRNVLDLMDVVGVADI